MKINIISKTTVLCLLCFLLCHAVVVCAQNEGGWFRLSADDVKPAKTPNIAIINKHNDKTLADLLFAELAKDNKISLVERERLDLILKEQEYSSTSRSSNIKLGKLLKADGLLFIEPDKDFIHIRLVETGRGVRLADDVFGKKTKIDEIAKIIQTRISNLSSKLLLKPENRIFISLLPVIPESKSSYTSKKGIPDNIILTINTLLGVHLFNGEGVLMPEREHFSDIVSEKKIQEEKSQSALSFADVVIRFKPITKKDKKITLQLQIIPNPI